MSRSLCLLIVLGLLLALILPRPARAQGAASATTVLNFEGFSDSTVLTNQYAGVVFTNAQILTAGVSLNEQEAPPHSGVNVVSDDNGPMSIVFTSGVTDFSGYFNYAEPLTIDAYNANNVLIASAQSLFTDNFALSGDPGSSPNELLQVDPTGDISRITITGDPLGGSFTLDDATFTSANSATATPEPGTAFTLLMLTGLVLLAVLLRRVQAARLS